LSFLNPLALWALTAIIPLAAVYLLKIKPRRQPTTALFLWQQILSQRKSSTLFQRLRHLLSLLMMLLAFIAIVMMMARPQFGVQSKQDLLIVIDHSASMNAMDHGSTRLQQAKANARQMVLALHGRQRAAVAILADDLVYLCHLTDDTRQLTDAIDAIKPGHTAITSAALAQVGQQPAWAREHRVIVLSDGCFDLKKWPENQHVSLERIGTPQQNVGITVCDLRPLPATVPTLGLYVQLASTYDKEIEVELSLSYLGQAEDSKRLVKLWPMKLKPGVNDGQVFEIADDTPGRWVLELDHADALAEDNVASLIVEQPSPVKVGVAAEPRYFFQHAVNAFAGHQAMMVLSEADQADVVLAQQAAPKAACAVIFAPQQTSPWWENVGTPLEAFVPKVQIKDHPALRYLDMSALRFTGARQVKLPIGTVVWVQSDQGVPLVWWGQHAGQSAIVVNMDPAEDSFYLSPYFPVMIQSFASYLAGRQAAPPSTYRPGQRVLLDAPTQTYSPKLEQLGFTTVGPSQKLIACSLLSEVDSLVGDVQVKENDQPIAKGQAPAYWFGVLASCLLSAECLLYHRRKVD
jgi:hypothetical protein